MRREAWIPDPHELREWFDSVSPHRVVWRGTEGLTKSPLREDRHPSFGFSAAKGCAIDRATGETWSTVLELAAAMGVEPPASLRHVSSSIGTPRRSRAEVEKSRRQDERAEAERRAKGAEATRQEWERASPASEDHEYLRKKSVGAHGLRQNPRGELLVPMRDIAGQLVGLQRIGGDGSKRLAQGSKLSGSMFALGDMDAEGAVLIAEGYATGASLYELAEGKMPVAVCFSATNIGNVARELRDRAPSRPIVVCADNDDAGTGAARKARAEVAGVGVAAAPEPGEDWNDTAARLGPDAARDALRTALKAALVDTRKAGEHMMEKTKRHGASPVEDGFGDLWEGIAEGMAEVVPLRKNKAETAEKAKAPQRRYNAVELMGMSFPEPKWLVPGIIPEGLTLLVAAPKCGKSTMCLHTAVSVALGGSVFGSVDVKKGSVLYYALEDSERRMHDNLHAMAAGAKPHGLDVWFSAPRVGEGLEDEIDAWLTAHPDARAVIVDTLAKVRPPKRPGADAYDLDYRTLGALKGIADRHSVAMIVVHHTRKSAREGNAGGDWTEESLGSQALTGASDTILMLKRVRGSKVMTLHRAGRDVDEAEIAISFDKPTMTYRLEGDAQEVRLSAERKAIVRVLRANGEVHYKEIAEIVGKTQSYVKVQLSRMVKEGLVDRGERAGFYYVYSPCEKRDEEGDAFSFDPAGEGGEKRERRESSLSSPPPLPSCETRETSETCVTSATSETSSFSPPDTGAGFSSGKKFHGPLETEICHKASSHQHPRGRGFKVSQVSLRARNAETEADCDAESASNAGSIETFRETSGKTFSTEPSVDPADRDEPAAPETEREPAPEGRARRKGKANPAAAGGIKGRLSARVGARKGGDAA